MHKLLSPSRFMFETLSLIRHRTRSNANLPVFTVADHFTQKFSVPGSFDSREWCLRYLPCRSVPEQLLLHCTYVSFTGNCDHTGTAPAAPSLQPAASMPLTGTAAVQSHAAARAENV